MAFTQADVDAIDRAIAAGELEVRIDDKIVKFQSASDLFARRTAILRIIGAAAAPSRVIPRHQLADFSDDV